jgi:hypothetical protein
MFSKKVPCPRCKTRLKEIFSFCPFCGIDLRNPKRDMEEYGFFGRTPLSESVSPAAEPLGLTDKVLNSLITQIMKSFAGQLSSSSDITQTPTGLTIRVGSPQENTPKKIKHKGISEEQVKRMTGLPRVEAKTNVRRLSDRVVYELKAPDISSVEDIFVSKLAEGYEIRAIGKRKVYLNNLAVELPLRGYTLTSQGIVFEFALQ